MKALFTWLTENALRKSRVKHTRQYQVVQLVLGEAFFLLVVPWALILPAWFIQRWLSFAFPRAAEWAVGAACILLGLGLSLWAVRHQWKTGKGTPSLSAPTQRLVTDGPYGLCRNPIQLGALLYVLGLGTVCFSFATGLLASAAGLIVAVAYIKNVEEKELLIRFGEHYDAYRKRTPMLFPFTGRRTKHARESLADPDELPEALPTRGRVLVRAAAIYDAVQPLVTLGQEGRMNRWMAEQLPLTEGMAALDVGCGTGLLTVEIARRHPGCSVEGIDASKPMVQIALRKRSLPNCTFRQALAEDLPYPDQSLDLVTSALFFHHVNRQLKRQCLREIRRVLKPGARLVIADMDRPYNVLGWLLSYGAWLVLWQPEIKENIDGVLREEVRRAGFRNLQV